MNETADELERLAEEFERSRQDQQDRCAKAMEAGAVHAEITARARAGTLEEVVNRLRERAAEIRAQRSGPAYKAQPKPSEVREKQWWLEEGETPRQVSEFYQSIHGRCAVLGEDNGHRIESYVSALLTSPRWTYLGDGPEPAR